MKLLLIDDDELDRQAIIRTFKKSEWNIDITQADSAYAGLAQFELQDFDAVLLDFHLPDLNGLEALQLLINNTKSHAAIIILTGTNADDLLERQCIEAGAQDVLFKSEIAHKHLTRAITHARTRHLLERQLLESHMRLQALAENDALTGLANRYYFDESLKAAIPRAERMNDQLALLFLDLDNFKLINDSQGHNTGDKVLKEVAERLIGLIRSGDIACRLGGDEFAILAYNFENEEAIALLAQRILDELRKPILINGIEHIISVSIGIATFPDAGNTSGDLLKASDLAMYRAKHDGRNNFQFFSQALQAQIQARVRTEKDLRALIPTDHFVLFYQPIVDAQTCTIVGAESLIRWEHPVRGILPPSEFIELAEEIGLMQEIDSRTRLKACKQIAKWREEKLVDDAFCVKFNVCAPLLKDEDLHLAIQRDLMSCGLPGYVLGLEITESILIENLLKSASLLAQIQALGLEISVDDFGTGYSSMAYLKELPARTLKIDRKFVQGIPGNLADCRILRALIVFAKSLDLKIIVEGVETRDQARFCRDCGADQLQGYLFSKPLPANQFENLIKEHNPDLWVQQLATLLLQ
jgi:diguanylate cyclase